MSTRRRGKDQPLDRSTADHRWAATETLAQVQAAFLEFADVYPHLPLYRSICAGCADDDQVASLLLAAQPGQRRPVLFLAALHDLVLRRPDLSAARWYPSVVGPDAVPEGDPWPDIRATVLDHAETLRHVIATRATQTNEVNRCVYVAALLHRACADVPHAPVALLELGASAGLLLNIDRYRLSVTAAHGQHILGEPGSDVRCEGRDDSADPTTWVLPQIAARVGLDRAPITADDTEALRWLQACLWPDEPGRVERFVAATSYLRRDAPDLITGDIVDDLRTAAERTLSAAGGQAHLVVMSSWAVTYVKRDRRAQIVGILGDVAARAGAAVSWVSAEPLGCVPGLPGPDPAAALAGIPTVLGAYRWRGRRALPPVVWGAAHPHGRWVRIP